MANSLTAYILHRTMKLRMKLYTPILLTLLITSCADGPSLTLQNTQSEQLENQPLLINRSNFDIGEDDYLLFLDDSKKPIPAQFDDLTGDGIWDEVALELSFDSFEALELKYEVITESQILDFEIKTAAHLGYSQDRDNSFVSVIENVRPSDHVAQSTPFLYQFEGPGWESDKVAFRAYFDSRNGKDIFGKTTSEMLLPSVGLGDNYHELNDWGMDILKVGGSLGAGAVGMLKNDTIYRLTNTKKARFSIIHQGPVRTVIELTYEGWEVEESTYDLIETISIWAGKRHYESVLRLSGDGQDTLVTGIVNLKGLAAKTVDGPNSSLQYTYGKQSESGDYLGLGLIVPKDGLIAFGEAPISGAGVTNTYTALLKPVNGLYQYAFYAGWELENPDFTNEGSFIELLKTETILFNTSIEIKK